MTMSQPQFLHGLRPVDILVAIFLVILPIIHLLGASSLVDWVIMFLANIAIIFCIRWMATVSGHSRSNFLRVTYDFYPVLMILFIFKEVHVVIQSMARADIDDVFIAIDRALFGGDPTVWVTQFTTPLLTEILQIAYVSYYFLMILLGVELYRKSEHDNYALVLFAIVYGFMLSYIGYMLFPGVGPRFTLHDFYSLNEELPGLWFTDAIRDFINAGESIPKGAENAMALAQRDIFPSGHTQMTLITMYYAWKFSIRSRFVIYVLGTLLIISTVYMRYHYVIDVIGGAVFMMFTVWTTPALMKVLRGERT